MSQRPISRRVVVSLLAMGVATACGTGSAVAFSQEPLQQSGLIDPTQIPQVHNTFYTVPEGTVGWDVLGDLEVTAESLAPLRTIYRVSYSPEIMALHGQDVKLMGFIYPLEGGLEHKHFLLTAWPPSCPFCLPAGPSQMVDVYGDEPIEFTDGAIMIAGRFEVLKGDPSGIYYRMRDAREVERYDDIRWTGQLPQQPQAPQ